MNHLSDIPKLFKPVVGTTLVVMLTCGSVNEAQEETSGCVADVIDRAGQLNDEGEQWLLSDPDTAYGFSGHTLRFNPTSDSMISRMNIQSGIYVNSMDHYAVVEDGYQKVFFYVETLEGLEKGSRGWMLMRATRLSTGEEKFYMEFPQDPDL
jgi:hypothetical protein